MATYKVSGDGKTVSVSGKTYTLPAFKKQFNTEPGVPLDPGSKGYAAPNKNAKAPVKINTNPTGKTRIGRLAGGAGGGMFGIKNR